MLEYDVPIVRREYIRYWREYNCTDNPSKEAKRLGRRGLLGLTHGVKARNKREAARKAEEANPGHIAIAESISGGMR